MVIRLLDISVSYTLNTQLDVVYGRVQQNKQARRVRSNSSSRPPRRTVP